MDGRLKMRSRNEDDAPSRRSNGNGLGNGFVEMDRDGRYTLTATGMELFT
jgi:hypothetical protein